MRTTETTSVMLELVLVAVSVVASVCDALLVVVAVTEDELRVAELVRVADEVLLVVRLWVIEGVLELYDLL